MIIEKLNKYHIEAAAKIVSHNYLEELKQVPSLPRKDFYDYFYNSISDMQSRHYGVVAIQNETPIGFLSGIAVEEFKGLNKGIYCPIYAHGAIGDKKDIYQRMYEHVSDTWVGDGCITHAVSIFAHEEETVDTWFDLGFGNCCVDAMRPLTEITGLKAGKYQIRQVTECDASSLLPLFIELNQYFSRAPLFMHVSDTITIDDIKKRLTAKDSFTWVAFDNEKPVAIMSLKKGGEYQFVAEDEKTINICSAYALEETRGTGVSAGLLDRIVWWAKKSGYERLGVDYESFNRYGSRFWSKHFTPFAYCLLRKLDERILSTLIL